MAYVNQTEIDFFVQQAQVKIASLGLEIAEGTLSGKEATDEVQLSYELQSLIKSLLEDRLDWEEREVLMFIHYYNDRAEIIDPPFVSSPKLVMHVVWPGSVGDALENVSEDTTPQAGGEFDLQAHSIGGTVQTATGDGTTTIDWKLGNMFDLLLVAASAPEVLTFTAPTKPGTFMLKLKQHSTGGQTITWPGTVKWAGGTPPTLSSGNGEEDIITFYYNGTSYFAVDSLDFS